VLSFSVPIIDCLYALPLLMFTRDADAFSALVNRVEPARLDYAFTRVWSRC
jgi:hypothetical protein